MVLLPRALLILLLPTALLFGQAPSEEEQRFLYSIVPLIEARSFAEAEAGLLEALKQYPRSAILQNALGIVYRQENKPEAAIAAIEKALEILPQFTAAQLHLGSLYAEAHRCGQAIPLLVAASDGTTNEGALATAGLSLAQCEDYRRAAVALRKASALNPNSASMTYNLALALYKDGQFKEALEALNSLPESDRETEDALSLRGRIRADAGVELIRNERYQEAADLLQASSGKAESSVAVLSAFGLAQFRLGRYRDAIQTYSRAIQLDSKLDAPREGLAFLLYMTGDLEQARTIAEQGLTNPDADFYLSHLHSMILYRISRELWLEALKSVSRALKQNASFAPGYFLRGKIEMEQGDLAAALLDFQAAVKLDSKFPLPYYKMAQIYIRQGRGAEAEASRKRFSELGSLREEEVLTRQTQDTLLGAVKAR